MASRQCNASGSPWLIDCAKKIPLFKSYGLKLDDVCPNRLARCSMANAAMFCPHKHQICTTPAPPPEQANARVCCLFSSGQHRRGCALKPYFRLQPDEQCGHGCGFQMLQARFSSQQLLLHFQHKESCCLKLRCDESR